MDVVQGGPSGGGRAPHPLTAATSDERQRSHPPPHRPSLARVRFGSLSPCGSMEIHFLGGATTVTGSQHLLVTGQAKVLIDCGMFQGSPNESIRNRLPFDFDPATLDGVLLTHAHLDHCGLIPPWSRPATAGRSTRPPARSSSRRWSCSTPASSTRSSRSAARAGRSATPTRPRPRTASRRPTYEAAVALAADGEDGDRRRRHDAPAPAAAAPAPTASVRAADRRARRDDHRTAPRPDGARLADRPRGRPPRPAAAPPRRPRRAALHGAGRRARRWRLPAGRLRAGDRGGARGPGAVRGRRPHPRLGDHPADRHRHAGRRGAGHRLLRRPWPARHADPARPDAA